MQSTVVAERTSDPWTLQLQLLQDEMSEARENAEGNPSDGNHVRPRKTCSLRQSFKPDAKAGGNDSISEPKERWQEAVESQGPPNDEEIRVPQNYTGTADRRAVNLLADHYADDSKILQTLAAKES